MNKSGRTMRYAVMCVLLSCAPPPDQESTPVDSPYIKFFGNAQKVNTDHYEVVTLNGYAAKKFHCRIQVPDTTSAFTVLNCDGRICFQTATYFKHGIHHYDIRESHYCCEPTQGNNREFFFTITDESLQLFDTIAQTFSIKQSGKGFDRTVFVAK